MERKVGTISRGIRCPIIREGDDISSVVVNSVLEAAESEGYEIRDRDIVAVTESVVARSQGNYASVEAISKDVKAKLGSDTIGVIFPILSRNRFAICLRGISMAAKKIVLMLVFRYTALSNIEESNQLCSWYWCFHYMTETQYQIKYFEIGFVTFSINLVNIQTAFYFTIYSIFQFWQYSFVNTFFCPYMQFVQNTA